MPDNIVSDKLTINGQEYSPEDASQLIELGNKYRETEKNLNTPIEKLMPEYTKATQRAARADQLEKELAERTSQLEELQTKANKTQLPEDKQAALRAAREMGLADKDYLKEEGYIKKSDLDDYFNKKQTDQKLVENVLKQADKLEKEIDGSDGRVPFNQKAVLAYASAYNISDLNQAYEEMNDRGNAKWKDAQIAKSARPGLTTLKPGGVKTPTETKVTDDNFGALWNEMFPNKE